MPKNVTQASIETPAHALSGTEVLTAFNSRESGLSPHEANAARERFGPNKIPAAKRKPAVIRFLAHFNNVLIYILLVAGMLKAVNRDWVDFWVIIAVAVVNAAIGYIQEGQAEKAISGIRDMLSLHATVLHDGLWQEIDAEYLVPGDVVRFGPGDKIPADTRILTAQRLKIDESMLTGESEPAEKNTDNVEANAGIGDRANIAHSGTVVTQGNGTGVVYATGANTEIGHIQDLVDSTDDLKTPLTAQLDNLGTRFAQAILGVSLILLFLGRVIHDMTPSSLLSNILSFAVATVPEGLPALVTITLALGVQQMATHNAITRKMGAVETLGAVTTICSDKTGTLTRNEMTALAAITPSARYEISGTGFGRAGDVTPAGPTTDPEGVAELARIMSLCNDAVLRENGDMWSVVGEPTEAALAIFSDKQGFDSSGIERIASIPFDSAHKFMAVRVANPGGGTDDLLLKGAPDVLFSRCTTQRAADGEGKVSFDLAFWESQVDSLASQGMRVLAAARCPASSFHTTIEFEDVANSLELVGLIGLIDPPRAEAIEAIAICHEAGIAVKMITGDHVETAKAISRQLNLRPDGEPVAVTGAEIEKMSRSQLAEHVVDIDVFARTSPEHKIRIVDALQSHDQVVAMTGDGANDAPALTRADVGIAMGIKGTEATKEAADMVLADDNFATIEKAVAEGRRIYDNIIKSVVFMLPTSIGQGLIVLFAMIFGWDAPLAPTQILWVNLITAVTLSVALAFEPAEEGIMNRNPRGRKARLLAPWLWIRIMWISVLIAAATMGAYYALNHAGVDTVIARTTAVTVLVVAQMFVLINSRFLYHSSLNLHALTGNNVLWISSGSLLTLHLLFVYAPFMNTLFDSTGLGFAEWGIAVGAALVIFLIVEVIKASQNRFYANKHR